MAEALGLSFWGSF